MQCIMRLLSGGKMSLELYAAYLAACIVIIMTLGPRIALVAGRAGRLLSVRGVKPPAPFLLPLLAALLVAGPAVAFADWKPVEKVEPYQIAGRTGPELYASIGERGPEVSVGRAISYTTFDLTWQRDYRPQPDGACTLVTARPKLIIIYALPEPSEPLAEPTATNWRTFIDGVTRHEYVHGEMIVDMVKEIEAVSIGLSAADDPGCRKVRAKLQERLPAISQARQQRSREFDRTEMSNGGAVHQLVLDLVKGG
jgi:predicted secreted Zn-dependent protease